MFADVINVHPPFTPDTSDMVKWFVELSRSVVLKGSLLRPSPSNLAVGSSKAVAASAVMRELATIALPFIYRFCESIGVGSTSSPESTVFRGQQTTRPTDHRFVVVRAVLGSLKVLTQDAH